MYEVNSRLLCMELSQRDLHQARLKVPFQFPIAFRRIEKIISDYPKAMLFELADLNYRSPFQQLVASIISVRTLDEFSLDSALQIIKKAPTPFELDRLSEREIDELIFRATYHEQKAKTLKQLARVLIEQFRGNVPCNSDELALLPGVSPQTASLVLGIACNVPQIAVNTHVHRIVNRWGIIKTVSAKHSRAALERIIPKQFWIELNRILLPFGKHVCTAHKPKCASCPVLEMCAQVGVENSKTRVDFLSSDNQFLGSSR